MNYILRISWIACAFLLFQNNCGWGSGGSIISAGALGRCGGGETGYRQLIKLKVNGGILSAIPQNSPIRLITMYAPGLKDGHLIIRELELPDKQKSVLISAPTNIHSHVKRATIYLSPASSDVLLYQHYDSGWKRLEPIKLITPSHFSDQAGLDEMWAYSVTRLGHFRLSYRPLRTHTDSVLISSDRKAGLIPMGSFRRGVFPWICAGFLFITIGTLSYIIHKIECKGAN
ncbi:hypothetical protein ACFLZE_01560 [Thermodesulfobacteriota bacterium]